jgi:hypothetical protein
MSIDLRAVAEAVGPGLGPQVVDGSAELLPIAVAGTDQTAVWLVRDDLLGHPLQVYVGRWPDGSTRVLSDDPEAWADLMQALGVRLDDVGTALEHVRAFLEITRASNVIVQEVRSVDDLPWRPGSDDEEVRRATLLAGPALPPPLVEATGSGFHVELTLVVDQRIQRNLFDVTADGSINASFRVIAEDLPLPIAR